MPRTNSTDNGLGELAMLILIARRDNAVIACTDDGETTRFHECRNVQCAVALEAKLNGDIAFAAGWVFAWNPQPSNTRRHGLERCPNSETATA